MKDQYYSTGNYQVIHDGEKAICVQFVDWKTQVSKSRWIPKSVCILETCRLFIQQWWADKNNILPAP